MWVISTLLQTADARWGQGCLTDHTSPRTWENPRDWHAHYERDSVIGRGRNKKKKPWRSVTKNSACKIMLMINQTIAHPQRYRSALHSVPTDTKKYRSDSGPATSTTPDESYHSNQIRTILKQILFLRRCCKANKLQWDGTCKSCKKGVVHGARGVAREIQNGKVRRATLACHGWCILVLVSGETKKDKEQNCKEALAAVWVHSQTAQIRRSAFQNSRNKESKKSPKTHYSLLFSPGILRDYLKDTYLSYLSSPRMSQGVNAFSDF